MRDVLKAKKALQDLGQEGMMRGVNAHEAMVIIVMLMMVLAVKGCEGEEPIIYKYTLSN